MAANDTRIVEFPVVVEAQNDKGEVVDRRDYGKFSGRIRDYDASLSIELKTDMLLRERGMDPDQVSSQSRLHFLLLAEFSVTCEKMPEGFSVEELMHGRASEAVDFLLAYDRELVAAEERFRQGGKETPKPVTMG